MSVFKIELSQTQINYQTLVIEAPSVEEAKRHYQNIREIVDEKFDNCWEVCVPDYSDSAINVEMIEELERADFEDGDSEDDENVFADVFVDSDGEEFGPPDITWKEITAKRF